MRLTIIILLITSFQASAQMMDFVSGLEKTVAGAEGSVSIQYESKHQWRAGVFYQQAVTIPLVQSQEAESPYAWYGVSISVPMAKTEKVSFYGRLRAGYANESFMVLVPSLETKLKISRKISLSVGSSYRLGHTAFSIQTHLKLF